MGLALTSMVWRSALVIVKPATVIAWHRQGFRWYWSWKIRHGRTGRPSIAKETRELIRTISRDNPLWGSPRIHSELLKLGINVSFQRHGSSDCSVDRAANRRSVSLRQRTEISLARPRYGYEFRKQLEVMDIEKVLGAARSPWQRAYVERVSGSIRRECLDHVIVYGEESLLRMLRSYFRYYHGSRLHLSLHKDSPNPRTIQSRPSHHNSSSRWPAPL
jgi:Integrase core domain